MQLQYNIDESYTLSIPANGKPAFAHLEVSVTNIRHRQTCSCVDCYIMQVPLLSVMLNDEASTHLIAGRDGLWGSTWTAGYIFLLMHSSHYLYLS